MIGAIVLDDKQMERYIKGCIEAEVADHQISDKEDQVSSTSSAPTSRPTWQNEEISKHVAVKERRITEQKQGCQVFAARY